MCTHQLKCTSTDLTLLSPFWIGITLGSALASLKKKKWFLDGVLFTFSCSTQSPDVPPHPTRSAAAASLWGEKQQTTFTQRDTGGPQPLRPSTAKGRPQWYTASPEQCHVGWRASVKRIKSAGQWVKTVTGFIIRNLKRVICFLLYILINKGMGEISGGLTTNRNYSEQQQKRMFETTKQRGQNQREHGVNHCHLPYD